MTTVSSVHNITFPVCLQISTVSGRCDQKLFFMKRGIKNKFKKTLKPLILHLKYAENESKGQRGEKTDMPKMSYVTWLATRTIAESVRKQRHNQHWRNSRSLQRSVQIKMPTAKTQTMPESCLSEDGGDISKYIF